MPLAHGAVFFRDFDKSAYTAKWLKVLIWTNLIDAVKIQLFMQQ